MKLLLFFILIISLPSFAKINHDDPKWLKLLRYQKGLTGYTSEVDSKEFFFHKEGKTNPDKELNATLNAFSEKENRCRFPARAIILDRAQNLEIDCPEYKKFIDKVNLKSVSLIFSSYFIEKPASAFGHTFFRLRSKDSGKYNNELLDYGVDYSAQVTTNNPLLYGIYGIIGGFKGNFKMMPYYYKVREYNDTESRDLWDYELNFNEDDLRLFMAHLYEMNQAYFDYFYFTENCSYHILEFVDAIRPDWKLMEDLDLFVPPVQTIYALFKEKNIVRDVNFRPSLYKNIEYRLKSLNTDEKSTFEKLVEDKIKLEQTDNVKVIDAYSDYLDFKYSPFFTQKNSPEYAEFNDKKYDVNLKRSQIEQESETLSFEGEKKMAPEKGHETKRIRIAPFYRDHKIGGEFEYRFSFHDFMDKKAGFIPFSSTEMGRIETNFYDDKFRLDNFTVVSVDAIRPLSELSNSLSWRFSFGLRDYRPTIKQEYAPFVDISLGQAVSFGNFAMALFLRAENSYWGTFDRDLRIGLGPEILVIYNNDQWSMKINFKRLHFYSQLDRYRSLLELEMRYHVSKNAGISVGYERETSFDDKYVTNFYWHF
ncbi:DUF4105 domain-containing protein [Halobacteriovorax sp. GB3]|uniref:Lnb N-terminal periplasmic domain-containing protein n=1 Tax=Halobacteriovorax sp. GB3 TaxID=2719615 RepID=UPI002361832D|nr:DUF4105 domain-containing protein [Halobacteriovorax sp. GB3]MDD0854298.1 DUF4105 domain-containing protein [Halobacteriovorax sp. GB3]